jgi:hypothetical protein
LQASTAAIAMNHMGRAVTAPSPKAIAALAKLGLTLKDMKGLGTGERIRRLIETVNKYKGDDKNILVRQLIGGHYDKALLRMSTQIDVMNKALNLAGNDVLTTGRVFKGLALEAQTAQGKINRFVESFKNSLIPVGEVFIDSTLNTPNEEALGNAGDNLKDLVEGVTGSKSVKDLATDSFSTLTLAGSLGLSYLSAFGAIATKYIISTFKREGGKYDERGTITFTDEENKKYNEKRAKTTEDIKKIWDRTNKSAKKALILNVTNQEERAFITRRLEEEENGYNPLNKKGALFKLSSSAKDGEKFNPSEGLYRDFTDKSPVFQNPAQKILEETAKLNSETSKKQETTAQTIKTSSNAFLEGANKFLQSTNIFSQKVSGLNIGTQGRSMGLNVNGSGNQ